MRLRDVLASAVGAVVLAVPATAMGSTLIGTFVDGNRQGVDSSQTATNGSGGAEFSGNGTKFIPGDSKPNLSQSSSNTAVNHAAIGGGAGTMIGDGTQDNTQAIVSGQAAKKGKQISTNLESGTQLIGLHAGDAILGDQAQVSGQGENSLQSNLGSPTPVVTVILGPVNKGPLTETSSNTLISCEVIIGGC